MFFDVIAENILKLTHCYMRNSILCAEINMIFCFIVLCHYTFSPQFQTEPLARVSLLDK